MSPSVLPGVLSDENGGVYELVGEIHHTGGADRGHYTAQVRVDGAHGTPTWFIAERVRV